MKIYKRETTWKTERFLTANLWLVSEDELELLSEFNKIDLNRFTILHQRNPVRKDENTFEEEHLRLEVEYEGKLLRVFACNDIEKYIKMMDHANEYMENKDQEISEIVDSLKMMPWINVLSNNDKNHESGGLV